MKKNGKIEKKKEEKLDDFINSAISKKGDLLEAFATDLVQKDSKEFKGLISQWKGLYEDEDEEEEKKKE